MDVHVSLTSASIRDRQLIRRYYIFEDGNEVGILVTTNKKFTEIQPRKSASKAVLDAAPETWEDLANG